MNKVKALLIAISTVLMSVVAALAVCFLYGKYLAWAIDLGLDPFLVVFGPPFGLFLILLTCLLYMSLTEEVEDED